MVVRKRRKKNKMRGNRLHGHGNTANRRGSGSRGGVGRAGSHKHKFSKYYMTFGTKIKLKKNNVTKRQEAKCNAITLEELQNMAPMLLKKKIATMNGSTIEVDAKKAGFTKVIAKGNVWEKFLLKNCAATRKATERILAAGGSIEKGE